MSDKDIAAQLRAQADQEEAAAKEEGARAAADRALADELDPPAAPPAADPPDSGPTLVDFDPSTATRAGGEQDVVPVYVDGAIYYGGGGRFTMLQITAPASVRLDNATFGDPAPGVTKAGYVLNPAMLVKPPVTEPPAPVVTDPPASPPTVVDPPPVVDPAPTPVDPGVPPSAPNPPAPSPVAAPPSDPSPPAAPSPAPPPIVAPAPPAPASDAITIVTPLGETVTLDRTPGTRVKVGASATLYARFYGENLLVLENGIKDVPSDDASGTYVVDGVSHAIVLRALEREPILLDGKMPAWTLTADQVKAWEDANLIFHYGADPADIVVDSDKTFETDGTAGEDPYMATTGAAGGIGVLTHKEVAALILRTPDAIAAAVADGLEATNWPVHYCDTDGTPIPLGKYPAWANQGATTPGEPLDPDVAHIPNLCAGVALIARANGSAAFEAFFTDESLHWVSFAAYFSAPESRDHENHVNRPDGGSMQLRGSEHAVSHFGMASGMIADGPMRQGIRRSLASTLELEAGVFVTGDYDATKRADGSPRSLQWFAFGTPGSGKNDCGFLVGDDCYGYYPGSNASEIWQQGFGAGLALLCRRDDLSGQDLVNAKAVRDFHYQLLVDTLGLHWQWLGIYAFPTSTKAAWPGWYTREEAWAALFAATGVDPTKADPTLLYTHDSMTPLGSFWGSYFGNLFQYLVQAVEDRYVSPVTGNSAVDLYRKIVGTASYKALMSEAGSLLTFTAMPKSCTIKDPLAGLPDVEPVDPGTPIVTEPTEPIETDPDDGYEPTTEFLPELPIPADNPLGGTPEPYPAGFRRTLAHPVGFVPLATAAVVKPTGATPGTVVTIPDSALVNSVTSAQATEDISHELDVWSAGAFAPIKRQFQFGPPGGHNGGNASTVFGIEVNGFVGRMFYTPSPLVRKANDDSSDMVPGPEYGEAVHQYGTDVIVTDGGREKLFYCGTNAPAFLFDSESAPTEQLPPVPMNSGESLTGATSVFDPKRACIWLHAHGPNAELKRFDLASRRWYHHGAVGNPDAYNTRTVLLINPVEDELVYLVSIANTPSIHFGRIPLATLKGVWQTVPFPAPDNFTACFDPIAKDLVVFASDPTTWTTGRWWAMDRLTGTVADLLTGGTMPGPNGMWGDLAHDAVRDEFLAVLEFNEDLIAFKRAR